ncbi:hypothetical protein [Bradyrhizobium japonicum]|nr:hypothetical protein [Bradyrhizobium japonicum]
MKEPAKDQGEEPAHTESLLKAEARQIIQQYIDDLREWIRKLRRKLN